ncbi:hypothetical protein DPMN_117967 [Dreissena polymorpha]|uniref:Secreted protein n=1 Tax=Dreissena polymorpha TaxID=45954 RepID=A0A9D4GFL8_DREPO|nr:hypothetical protein DPMN_117967 [Dreissena polymorpha]
MLGWEACVRLRAALVLMVSVMAMEPASTWSAIASTAGSRTTAAYLSVLVTATVSGGEIYICLRLVET